MKISPLANHFAEQGRRLAHKLPGSSVDSVAQLRKSALARFELTGLPRITDEQWRYTNIRLLEKHLFELSQCSQSSPGDVDINRWRLPEADTYRAVFLNGWFSAELSDLVNLPDSVSVLSLAQILDSSTDADSHCFKFALQELQTMSANAEHGFAALGAGLSADGAVVRVDSDASLDKPLELLFLSQDDADSRFCNVNSFIHAGRGARLQLIERYLSLGDTTHLTNSSVTFNLEGDAQVDHYRIQNESESAFHIGSAKTRQKDSSRYRIFSISLGARLNRHEVTQSLDGEHAHCELKGLYIGKGNQHIDNYTTIAHECADATSEEFYKGVLDDHARSVFHGRIKVAPGAQHTDAQQQNRNLLLSRNAEADTKPQLEIYADDVKCSHGATIGQLDENAVFYLRSRGLTQQQARTMLTDAFAAEIVREIELDPVLTEVSNLVQQKLSSDHPVQEAA
ncbi:MAG: Fe-S cluster assembly protein SufD [Acidiferrobacterales bacterium]|nr:Fe-S cluster assembly protein SufD [Acidiferrobacterales bacterium]